MWARELRSSPERPCELKDHPQTVTYYPTDLHPMSRHSDSPHRAITSHFYVLAVPTLTCATSRDVPVERDRMRAHRRCSKRSGASWAALPATTEGGAAEAAAEAAVEPPSEPRAGRAEACRQTGAREARIDRRVSSTLPTSRAARPAETVVVLVGAVTPTRLQLHLVIISRIDLLLWKDTRERT